VKLPFTIRTTHAQGRGSNQGYIPSRLDALWADDGTLIL
jgi:hypothetical protein